MTMQTRDSTLAYYINQLDNFDRKLHEPLTSVTWGRDIKLRTGVTLANESTSFTRNLFAASGSMNAGSATSMGMPWIGGTNNTLTGVDVSGERIVTPLRALGREITYTSIELERSQLTGVPIDQQKLTAFNTLYQMSTDQMVYIGDTEVGAEGLCNSSQVSSASVSGGAWGTDPDVIIAQVNELLNSAWSASAFAVCPSELRLPPAKFAKIASLKVSTAGNVSVLQYLEENSLSLRVNGRKLNIQPLKWLTGRGAAGADRMMCYTNDEDRLRFPMVPVRRDTAYYQGISFHAPYVWAFGEVEFVYPETVLYRDGI